MCKFNNARMAGAHGHAGGHPGFGRFGQHFGGWQSQTNRIPVNIRESKDWYELFVYAPGLNKDAFQVDVSSDVLSIRFQGDQQAADGEKWLHYEYARPAFERQFVLNGKVDTNAITARYTDGVLELTLPKLPGAAAQEISVA